jgi:hypothetical protein
MFYVVLILSIVLLMGAMEKSKLFNKLVEKFLNDEE